MDQTAIFGPFLSMMGLTLVVRFGLYALCSLALWFVHCAESGAGVSGMKHNS